MKLPLDIPLDELAPAYLKVFDKQLKAIRDVMMEHQSKVIAKRVKGRVRALQNFYQPGDLVFFNTLKRTFSHVGIYVGDGKFIHAPRPGKSVRVDDMREAYWQKRFNGARRVQSEKLQAEPLQN